MAFVLTLCVLGLAFLVAAAGEGRLDLLPPQQYFPAAFREPVTRCDRGSPDAPRVRTLSTVDDIEAERFSRHWRAAGESSLYLASVAAGSRDVRTYRFTWLRSFHAPVIVRVDELPNGEMRLVAKALSGQGGYSPGRIATRVERTLSREEAAGLKQALSASDVLNLPPVECNSGSDGARWLIEANDRGAYRFVNRWSPDSRPVRETGMLLLGFTGWRFDRVY